MIELRRVGPADAAEIARIHLAARDAAGAAFPPPVHEDDELLPHLLRDVLPHAEAWLAVVGGMAVGYLVVREDRIDDLYVDPEAQGEGVGSALLEHARTLRPSGLALWVFVSNRRAQGFYRRRGFEVVGGTGGDNDEGAPDFRMVWSPF